MKGDRFLLTGGVSPPELPTKPLKQTRHVCLSKPLVLGPKSGTPWLQSVWLYEERLIIFKTYTLRLITSYKPIEPEMFGDALKTGRCSFQASRNDGARLPLVSR